MAALRGGDVDRPPVSMWRHFFTEEVSAERLAAAMIAFQDRFDWDFIKVNPRASYHVEDWGVEMRYVGDAAPETVSTPIREPDDWLKLEVLDPSTGVLGEQLRALEIIADDLKGEVPFLMTVFTPFSAASRLAPSDEVFLRHLRDHEDSVRHGLAVVTETFAAFSRACLERGASGLFYATTSWATADRLTREQYGTLCRPYDLELLHSLPEAELHMLHVCRDNNLLSELVDYPVHAFNWDARAEGNPSLAEGKAMVAERPVVGGLRHTASLVEAPPSKLEWETGGMLTAMGRRGWMLGTGCTYPPKTPEENVRAIREAVGA